MNHPEARTSEMSRSTSGSTSLELEALRQLLLVLLQLVGERLVTGRDDLRGEHGGILRAAYRDGRYRNAGRHLHDRVQRVGAGESLLIERDADYRQRGVGCNDAGEMSRQS